MATNTAGSSARQDPRQVSNTMRGTILFSQQATFIPMGTLPKGAWVIAVQTSIDTLFNAGTTNPIVVGSVGVPNSLQQAADNTPGATGMYISPPGTGGNTRLGKATAAAADTVIGITYTPTGTAPTTGSAEVLVEFEGGFAATPGVPNSG